MHLSLITINIVISQKYFYCTGKYYYCTWKYYYCTGKYNHCTGKYYYYTGKYYYVTGNIINSCENIIIHIWKYHNVSSPSTLLLYQANPTPGMALSVHWFVRHVFTSSNTHSSNVWVCVMNAHCSAHPSGAFVCLGWVTWSPKDEETPRLF